MSKFNLSEAAKDILMNNVSSKQSGQDAPKKLDTSVAYGQKDVGKIGDSPEDMDDNNPDYTKGVPSAKPPGATPPVSSEPMKKLAAQPAQSGSAESVEQSDADEYDAIRDRKSTKLAKQTMAKNPGATFASYGEEFDVADDVDALMEGENLSEEFKQKATTIFEAAVAARVDYIAEQVQAELIEEMQEVIEEIKEDLATKVDDYLNYMVEEWMAENEIAIEKGLKSEIVEDFMTGLKNLFVEHYIDIPTEKVDVVEELTLKIEELEESLNTQILRGIELKKELNEQLKYEAIYTACEGLSQTQVEKMKALAEGVEFTSEQEFTSKLETLKESYFKSDVKVADILALDDEVQLIDEEKKYVKSSDPMMEQYAKTISQNLK
jgi:hypothetical protein